MQHEKSTKRSSESSSYKLPPHLDLELPVEPNFRPLPPLVSIEAMSDRIQLMRKYLAQGIPTEEERLARKTPAEFILKD